RHEHQRLRACQRGGRDAERLHPRGGRRCLRRPPSRPARGQPLRPGRQVRGRPDARAAARQPAGLTPAVPNSPIPMALEHITVLDLTHMLSGPYGTMLLADLGARTIKVEPPGAGEGTRRLLENDREYSRDGMGAYYLTLNRNKSSVCIDLKSEAGLAVFL